MESLVRIPQSELNATLERLYKEGVTQEHFKRLRTSRKYLKAVTKAFLEDDSVPVNYEDVRAILGHNFISPEEVATARGITYSAEQLEHFIRTLPPEEDLVWLRDNGFVLIPGPSREMSLLEIRNLNNKLFYSKEGGWYAEKKQAFSRDDKAVVEWIMIRKGIVPNSTSKTWEGQKELLSEVEYVPNAAEVLWVETTWQEVRAAWIFPDVYVRTSSVDSDDDHVVVGLSAVGGVSVHSHWDDVCRCLLGLASARKRNWTL